MSKPTAEEMKNLINNTTVSNDEVFEALKSYTSDVYDENGKIIPITDEETRDMEEVGELMIHLRPEIMERFRQYALSLFSEQNN